jgi:hypothetical protein
MNQGWSKVRWECTVDQKWLRFKDHLVHPPHNNKSSGVNGAVSAVLCTFKDMENNVNKFYLFGNFLKDWCLHNCYIFVVRRSPVTSLPLCVMLFCTCFLSFINCFCWSLQQSRSSLYPLHVEHIMCEFFQVVQRNLKELNQNKICTCDSYILLGLLSTLALKAQNWST